VEFDGVSWALCHERTPFVEMSLTGISLTNLRNRDQSGGCNGSSVHGYPASAPKSAAELENGRCCAIIQAI
jgi:hypothetical protein